MADKKDLAPEKVRLKDNYRERIFAESQKLDKSYLDTLYFIVDCYFVFIKAGLPAQLMANIPINIEPNKLPSTAPTPFLEEKEEDYGEETFSLDFDL
jgi:predicted nucleic acid binding AN1-type Zn finger protein